VHDHYSMLLLLLPLLCHRRSRCLQLQLPPSSSSSSSAATDNCNPLWRTTSDGQSDLAPFPGLATAVTNLLLLLKCWEEGQRPGHCGKRVPTSYCHNENTTYR
jgi:hypothetical protein